MHDRSILLRRSRRLVSRRSVAAGIGSMIAAMPAIALSPLTASAEQSAACGAPVELSDGWRLSTPEAAGLDRRRLCSVIDWLDGFPQANIHSILVVRRGELVFEHYRKGPDQRWGRPLGEVVHGPDVKHDLRSVTKSVIALLVGITLDRKLIPSLDQPVFEYFPEYADLRTPEKDRILLRHLLTMSAGLEWDEYRPYTDPQNSQIQMIRSPDRYRFALDRRVVAPSGQVWNYSGGCTELLGAVIRKAAARPLDQVAREFLFDPLGITDIAWTGYPNSDIPSAAGGLRLRARDLAKIGQLVLQRGQWDGRQVVPAHWIDEATAPQIGPADRPYFYGYQWWLGRSLINRRELPWVAGIGLGGQRVFVVPALDLVAVVTAGLYNDAKQSWVPLLILNRYLLAAVMG